MGGAAPASAVFPMGRSAITAYPMPSSFVRHAPSLGGTVNDAQAKDVMLTADPGWGPYVIGSRWYVFGELVIVDEHTLENGVPCFWARSRSLHHTVHFTVSRAKEFLIPADAGAYD